MNQLNLPKGRRLTRQRQIVLDDLRKKRCHLTATEIYQSVRRKLPNISLGTVYRNLKFLQEEGQIAGITCDPCSPEQFEGYADHCQHFICLKCKRIYDFKKPLFKNFKSGKDLVEGHLIKNYHLNFTGICNQCLKKVKS